MIDSHRELLTLLPLDDGPLKRVQNARHEVPSPHVVDVRASEIGFQIFAKVRKKLFVDVQRDERMSPRPTLAGQAEIGAPPFN